MQRPPRQVLTTGFQSTLIEPQSLKSNKCGAHSTSREVLLDRELRCRASRVNAVACSAASVRVLTTSCLFSCAQRGNYFAETSVRARANIAEVGARFIRPGSMLLVHGHSRVVLALLRKAVAQVSLMHPLDPILWWKMVAAPLWAESG
jgi:translation initiation factor 2B subunit (eIF-2B alpha/beta/delta family)